MSDELIADAMHAYDLVREHFAFPNYAALLILYDLKKDISRTVANVKTKEDMVSILRQEADRIEATIAHWMPLPELPASKEAIDK